LDRVDDEQAEDDHELGVGEDGLVEEAEVGRVGRQCDLGEGGDEEREDGVVDHGPDPGGDPDGLPLDADQLQVLLHLGGLLGDGVAHGDEHGEHVGDGHDDGDEEAEEGDHVVLDVGGAVELGGAQQVRVGEARARELVD